MTWPIKQHDLDPPYRAQLCASNTGIDLSGMTVRFLMKDI